jgi:hypothetical protein
MGSPCDCDRILYLNFGPASKGTQADTNIYLLRMLT